MMKLFILRILKAQIFSNKATLLILITSLTITSTLIFSLFTISSGIKEKLFNELKVYGANLIVYPKGITQNIGIGKIYKGVIFEEKYIIENDIENLLFEFKDLIDELELTLYKRLKLKNTDIDVIGVEFNKIKKIKKWWRIVGIYPEKEEEILIGKDLAKYFKLKNGDEVNIVFKDKKIKFLISGILETGGDEEKNIYVDIRKLQKILDVRGKINLCFLRVNTHEQNIESIVEKFKSSYKNLDFLPVKNVQYASESLLKKIKYLILFVAFYVSFQTLLSVSSTISIFVHQKRQEIALILAIGGNRKFIAKIFILESLFLGMISGILGILLGSLISQTISKQVFGSYISINGILFIIPIFCGIFVSLISFLEPLKKAMLVMPSEVLRGE